MAPYEIESNMNFSYQNIEALLRREDIEGLLQAGAPEDEYSSEARTILLALGKLKEEEKTEENIISILTMLWVDNFDLSADEIRLRLPSIQRVVSGLLSTQA